MNKSTCSPEEIALKSFFLGPQAENAAWVSKTVQSIFDGWFAWRRDLHPEDGVAISETDKQDPQFVEQQKNLEQYLNQLSEKFEKEVPKFSPRYVGHMVSEISLPALLGHILTLLHNPNNISEEVSRVGLELERDAIAALAEMLGFDPKQARGHFATGGTIANIEGLLRCRSRFHLWLASAALERHKACSELSLFQASHRGWESFDKALEKFRPKDLENFHPHYVSPFELSQVYEKLFGVAFKGPIVLVPDSKHYSWPKGISLLGLGKEGFWPVPLDSHGKQSVKGLRRKIELARKQQRPIMAVVSVAGTTELGDFDPIDQVQACLDELKQKEGLDIWHHVDAAYGGFFSSLPRRKDSPASPELFAAIKAIARANSVTIDPHKLGYVPYASGGFITRLAREYYTESVQAPYLKLEGGRHKGPVTLEGSRPASGAAATLLTAKSIGLGSKGYGRILERSIEARVKLEQRLNSAHEDIRIAPHSETNVLCFSLAREGELLSQSNARTHGFYQLYSPDAGRDFYVSETRLHWPAYSEYLEGFVRAWDAQLDTDGVRLIRLCLMNPFFLSKETKVNYLNEFVEKVLSFSI